MSNNQFNNLDNLFKVAAEGHELPFNERAWADMETKLDKEFGSSSKKGGFKLYAIVGLVLLLSGMAVYHFQKPANNALTENNAAQRESNTASVNPQNANTNETTIKAEKVNENTAVTNTATNNKNAVNEKDNTENTTIVANKKDDEKTDISNISVHKNETNKVDLNTNSNAIIKNNTGSKTANIAKSIIATKTSKKEVEKDNKIVAAKENAVVKKDIIIKENKKADKAFAVKSNVETKKASDNFNSNDIVSTPNKATNATTKTTIVSNNNNTAKAISHTNITFAKTYTAAIASNQMHKKYIPNFKAAEEEAKKPKAADKMFSANGVRLLKVYQEPTVLNRWYFALTGGSNTSFIRSPRLDETRYAANFFVGYNVSNHVSFQTGLAYRTGTYAAATNQFKYKGPDWMSKYVTGVQIDMAAIEIPIEIKYQFSDIPNKGLFFTAGFRKLLYRKDNNLVDLDYGTGTKDKYAWNLGNSATGFDLFQFSLGYQYRLNDKFILTAQQDIQLPVNYIGGAATQMISTGLQLGVRYNFGFINRSKK